MADKCYRLIFEGEIFPGLDQAEVRQRVLELLRYNQGAMRRLFSGGACVIKDHVSLEKAQELKAMLDETGIITYIQKLY